MMISKRRLCLAISLVALLFSQPALAAPGSWYFAVSGDSRDCGDLVMPKIARDLESRRAQTPAQFYWHLGDLRGMYRIDCDMLKRKYPKYDCVARPAAGLQFNDFNDYLKAAWDDFIQQQIKPFGSTPFILGIGNHELINRTREDFECKFSDWLRQPPLVAQFKKDLKRGVPSLAGNTYFHFVRQGVDFIYLDNADAEGFFSPEELTWLARVLAEDAKDKSIRTIIAGMHDALPLSTERGHAMDQSCKGFCSGMQAYDMLWNAQNLTAADGKRKHVYVLSSHSHFFRENIYDTQEHKGKVLPGWIVGTAGAEQYKQASERISYGYMSVEVKPDGTIGTRFNEVTRDSPPLATGAGAEELTAFCFDQNKRPPVDRHESNCQCGAPK